MKNNFFVHCLWSFPSLWRALQPLAWGVRPEVWKGVVSPSAFWVSFCILFSGGDLCPKTTLKKLGPWAGVTKSYSSFSHVMHACDLHSHEFSLVTPVRQEYLWSQVCPCRPCASRKCLSSVALKEQEGVTFLPIPSHVSRRHRTQELCLLSCSGFLRTAFLASALLPHSFAM